MNLEGLPKFSLDTLLGFLSSLVLVGGLIIGWIHPVLFGLLLLIPLTRAYLKGIRR